MSGTSSEAIQRAERDAEIVRLRRQGLTFQSIADRFDLSRVRVYKIVKEALAALPAVDAAEIRTQELERLEYLRERNQAIMDRAHYLAYQGYATGTEDDGPEADAIMRDVRISESIRRLTGADAPAKVETTGTVTARYEVVGVNMDDV
jgi:hypothetical protein